MDIASNKLVGVRSNDIAALILDVRGTIEVATG